MPANALPPDDLLGPSTALRTGLKRLAEVCTALEEAGVEDENCIAAAQRLAGEEEEIRNLRKALAARTDDRRII